VSLEPVSQPSSALRPILVLGMHRSGTSCLAGCLEEAGLWLGEVNRSAPFNRKGNRENRSAMELNDKVLASVGAAWDRPPERDPEWDAAALDDLAALLDSYPCDRVWGLKDPRVLLTSGVWLARTKPRLVGTYRHPLEVAASLQRRAEAWKDTMPHAHALALWRAYNQRLLARHDEAAFPVLRYDQPADTYRDKVRRIASELGLPNPEAITFLDPDLRHESADAPVPQDCADIWNRLNAIAV